MIPTPAGWRRFDLGDDALLVPPVGPEHGAVRFRAGLRPVLPVETLVMGQLADDPQFTVEAVTPARPLVTVEGERAAFVTVTGTLDGRAVRRGLGYVFGDDSYARVGALALVADTYERVLGTALELTRRVALGLTGRRRRVEHEGPPGWRAHHTGLRTDWLAPGFPDDPSCISVWPAVPRPRLSGGPPQAPPESGIIGPWPLHTARGLHGWSWRGGGRFNDGTARRRDLVLLADLGFRYACRLETTPERHAACRPLFLAVLDGLRPTPQPPGHVRRAAEVGEQWSE